MNEQLTLEQTPQTTIEEKPNNGIPAPPDAKQLRVTHVGALLEKAYPKASTLKLKKEEWQALRAEFPDEAIEVRSEGGFEMYYIEHAELRELFLSVFPPGEISEIVRSHRTRADTNEVLVDLVLLIRGYYAAEAVATVKYYPNSPRANFGDSLESAQSEAFRRCAKHFGVGLQVWRSAWQEAYKLRRSKQPDRSQKKVREYKLGDQPVAPTFKQVRETMVADEPDMPF